MRLKVNGEDHELELDARTSLLDALREELGLTGTKKGCDHGQCGACAVIVNGRRINSCLALAVMHEDDDVRTVEGLAGEGGEHHRLQEAFMRHDAFQCGYCTSGQLCSGVALLEEFRRGDPSVVTPHDQPARPTDEEIRERMSGNLCRCGAYVNIVRAIASVARESDV